MDVVVEVGVLEVLVLEQVDVAVDGQVLAHGLCLGACEGALQGVDVVSLDKEQLLLLLEVLVLYAIEVLVSLLDFLLGPEEVLDDVEELALLLGEHSAVLFKELVDFVVEGADDWVGLKEEGVSVLALGHVVVDPADGEEASVAQQVHQLDALPLLEVQHPARLDLSDYLLVDQLDLQTLHQVLVDPGVHLVFLVGVLWLLLLPHALEDLVGVLCDDLELAQKGGEIAL